MRAKLGHVTGYQAEPVQAEVLPDESMSWKCLDCRGVFPGPTNRTPVNGCGLCGSRRVLDLNVEPLHSERKPTRPARAVFFIFIRNEEVRDAR